MSTPPRNALIIIFCLILFSSCISVQLPGGEAQKSKQLRVEAPTSAEFQKIDLSGADAAWKSKQTANTISYQTDCTVNVIPIEKQRNDVLSTIPNAKLISSQVSEFDERESILSDVEGKIDGIPLRLQILNYSKNGCRYTVTYAGKKKNFASELDVFNKFLNGFRAP